MLIDSGRTPGTLLSAGGSQLSEREITPPEMESTLAPRALELLPLRPDLSHRAKLGTITLWVP
ncbi:MAG: hypothetical protein JWN04_824 [Myxococcaceae bacterium]|nr:hypothetical protein [Myxococcaceae bacterium]